MAIKWSEKQEKKFSSEINAAIAHHVSPTKAVSSPDVKMGTLPKTDESPSQINHELSVLWKRYEKNHTSLNAGDAEKKWNQNIFRHVESKYGLDTAKSMYGSAEALRRSGVKAMHAKYGIEESLRVKERDLFLTELVSVIKNRLPPSDNFIDRTIRNSITPVSDISTLEKKQAATSKRMLRAKASKYSERGIARGLSARTHSLIRMGATKVKAVEPPIVPEVSDNVTPVVKAPVVKAPVVKAAKVFRPRPTSIT